MPVLYSYIQNFYSSFTSTLNLLPVKPASVKRAFHLRDCMRMYAASKEVVEVHSTLTSEQLRVKFLLPPKLLILIVDVVPQLTAIALNGFKAYHLLN